MRVLVSTLLTISCLASSACAQTQPMTYTWAENASDKELRSRAMSVLESLFRDTDEPVSGPFSNGQLGALTFATAPTRESDGLCSADVLTIGFRQDPATALPWDQEEGLEDAPVIPHLINLETRYRIIGETSPDHFDDEEIERTEEAECAELRDAWTFFMADDPGDAWYASRAIPALAEMAQTRRGAAGSMIVGCNGDGCDRAVDLLRLISTDNLRSVSSYPCGGFDFGLLQGTRFDPTCLSMAFEVSRDGNTVDLLTVGVRLEHNETPDAMRTLDPDISGIGLSRVLIAED